MFAHESCYLVFGSIPAGPTPQCGLAGVDHLHIARSRRLALERSGASRAVERPCSRN
ncbi:hypothetical protein ARTHRO9AX_130051 [Arthrobacter sp. 9AX]|nr:hypothetical protein ARTHRO9AX_130051 [Arthrobacter sp. 9AX]